jgi:hypothetical protein
MNYRDVATRRDIVTDMFIIEFYAQSLAEPLNFGAIDQIKSSTHGFYSLVLKMVESNHCPKTTY